MEKWKPLGEVLLQRKVITNEQLETALKEQKATRQPLGEILLKLGYVPNETVLKEAIAEQLKSALLKKEDLKPKTQQRLKELIPKETALKNLLLPLSREKNTLRMAMAKPPDMILIDNLRKMTGCDIVPLVAMEADMLEAIERFYSSTQLEEVVSSSQLDEASNQYTDQNVESELFIDGGVSDPDQAPVVKLVELLLKRSIDDRASDIHIEPFKDIISFRYRIDGQLYELPPPPKQFHTAIVSRIKIMAKLDIAEKRIPQDGSFSINYQGRRIDIRVSTVPVVFGEKVVMRLLDKNMSLLDLNVVGMEPEQVKLFFDNIAKPYGLIFITGPTGSGKSTTLYAMLNKKKSVNINICTIEDPVEYQISGINQVQVKPDIGLTFASGLRAFLRQDPDVILVGEVRDQETAEICIRAALTGHLVFSTLHTNDAATAICRLIDIGIKPFLIASSLQMIAAQRLVRRLCEKCKEPYKPDEKMITTYRITADVIYKPKGCPQCRNIGYWGRQAVYEVLPVDENIRRIIAQGGDLDSLRKAQKEKGIETLLGSALRKVNLGVTSMEEALSVAYE